MKRVRLLCKSIDLRLMDVEEEHLENISKAIAMEIPVRITCQRNKISMTFAAKEVYALVVFNETIEALDAMEKAREGEEFCQYCSKPKQVSSTH